MHSKLLQQVESLKLEVHLCIGENFKSEAQGIEGLKHAVKVGLIPGTASLKPVRANRRSFSKKIWKLRMLDSWPARHSDD